MQAHDFYLADASQVLRNIEDTLNTLCYPTDSNLRRLVRSYCVARAAEEILLIQSTPRVAYLEHAYQLVKNAYAVNRHGFILGLLEDVNTFCLQSFRSQVFAFEANIFVRGRWLIARVNQPEHSTDCLRQ